MALKINTNIDFDNLENSHILAFVKKLTHKANIHLLSTDKPSRLIKNNLGIAINENFNQKELDIIQAKFVNICVTNDEEIKKGDWCYVFRGGAHRVEKAIHNDLQTWKKIILTTDLDLIKEGVQEIPDEFLEWFVQNPSCEEVKTIYGLFNTMGRQVDPNNLGQNHSHCVWKYKIIIPKEEAISDYDVMSNIVYGENVGKRIKIKAKIISKEEPKKECKHNIVVKYGVAECQNCGIEVEPKQEEKEKIDYEINSIYAKAVKHFGEENQLLKCVEEMAELQQVIIKFKLCETSSPKNKEFFLNLIEEIVDVEIMINQIKTIFNSEIETQIYSSFKTMKLARLQKLISENLTDVQKNYKT